ncbi:hypothetical protein N7519_008719 [Penicillium mononematosum]|uniref:uncharacterized protein n=1 Tax=Penicillium mononematosum TaxID=268346 RepID=UPI002548A692|nr:uncharacterized protein N7519_008719 [Penicillium mononematosum]KAJ6178258.1 hypothetical protein N7519_008719 [Penicillium mononematosum]
MERTPEIGRYIYFWFEGTAFRIIGPPVDEWGWWKMDSPHSSELIALDVVRAQNSARAAP